jgi:DNA-binding PadR family transcriptional regulator
MTTLGYALLGLLAGEPRSGYDLTQHMKQSVGFFWHAKHSQIYPELARLEAEGMVTHEVVEQSDRPAKKIYTITEAGMTALRRWITSPIEVVPLREELVLKAYYLWLADPQKAIELFQAEERRHREQLAHYESLLKWGRENLAPEQRQKNTPNFGGFLTLHRGISYEREYAQWCHWVVEELQKPGLAYGEV